MFVSTNQIAAYLEQRICLWREEAGTWAAEQPSEQETLELEDAEQAVD